MSQPPRQWRARLSAAMRARRPSHLPGAQVGPAGACSRPSCGPTRLSRYPWSQRLVRPLDHFHVAQSTLHLPMRGNVWDHRFAPLAVSVFAAVLMAAVVQTAYAHALLERSEPGAGTVVGADSPPRQISLWFSEPVDVTSNAISVLDADNRRVNSLDARVSSTDPGRVDVSVGDLDRKSTRLNSSH